MKKNQDEFDRLILWYVKCQNDDGRGATNKELEAFSEWYKHVQADISLIRLMLSESVCVTMNGNEPAFWLSEAGKANAKEKTQ